MSPPSPLTRKLLAALAGTLLSVAGIMHVASSEGQVYTAYPDPGTGGEPYTICRGHTGKDVHLGMRATQDQCDVWFASDLKAAEKAIQEVVRVPLMQGEYDAYSSFVFNVGERSFTRSKMLARLNAGDRKGACNEFPKWKYANKMVLNGLVLRRTEEQTMCHQQGAIVWAR